jgi:hypothetical protein
MVPRWVFCTFPRKVTPNVKLFQKYTSFTQETHTWLRFSTRHQRVPAPQHYCIFPYFVLFPVLLQKKQKRLHNRITWSLYIDRLNNTKSCGLQLLVLSWSGYWMRIGFLYNRAHKINVYILLCKLAYCWLSRVCNELVACVFSYNRLHNGFLYCWFAHTG